jgi:hypothetical protein
MGFKEYMDESKKDKALESLNMKMSPIELVEYMKKHHSSLLKRLETR